MGESDAEIEGLLDGFVAQMRPGSHGEIGSLPIAWTVTAADLRSAAGALLNAHAALIARRAVSLAPSPPVPEPVPEAS